jgi:hypothetical protein
MKLLMYFEVTIYVFRLSLCILFMLLFSGVDGDYSDFSKMGTYMFSMKTCLNYGGVEKGGRAVYLFYFWMEMDWLI